MQAEDRKGESDEVDCRAGPSEIASVLRTVGAVPDVMNGPKGNATDWPARNLIQRFKGQNLKLCDKCSNCRIYQERNNMKGRLRCSINVRSIRHDCRQLDIQ